MRVQPGFPCLAAVLATLAVLAERGGAVDVEDSALPAATARRVDFAADIKPLLEAGCVKCHGPRRQRGGLRLDRGRDALRGGESGPSIVPGDGAASLLVRLVAGFDAERVMPAEGMRLTAAEIGVLRAWIDQGAEWPETKDSVTESRWWSLLPLVQHAVPAAGTRLAPAAGAFGGEARGPLDAFVLASLAENGFAPVPTPEADRLALIRRLSFDLLGLPPSPDEAEEFAGDPAPDAYERLTDRLLASPRLGERWARHWMDVARFAETHGHDQDRIREHAWPYRDYLIESFNADTPYARFVAEQVAGDVLYPDEPRAVAALGFLAAGPWDESSLRDIREDTIDREIGRYLDRDDVVTAVMLSFTGVTVQCARCHDHKFDPVTQEDYYALQAVFAGVDKANRRYDRDPKVAVRRRELESLLAELDRGESAVFLGAKSAVLLGAASEAEAAEWETSLAGEAETWRVVTPEVFVSTGGAALARLADDSLLASGARPERDTYTVSAAVPLAAITAVRVEALADPSLPHAGPGRNDNGNFHLSELELLVFDPAATRPRTAVFRQPSADFNQEGWVAAHAIDRDEKTAWGIYPRVGEAHAAVFELTETMALPAGAKLTFVVKQLHGGGHLIGRVRLSVTALEPPSRAAVLPQEIRKILATIRGERSESERALVMKFVRGDSARREHAALPPRDLVFAAASDFAPDGGHRPMGRPRPVHVLQRGDIHKPLREAAPGALSCVGALPARFDLSTPEDEASRRVMLARWLTDAANPLTWRNIVNRVWHYHFSRGLVDTPNDFGRMGGTPSHPELLDWLAVGFRDGGGSLKQLHRLLVTSATYRQGTRYVAELASRDAENRLLWRRSPVRLDAESVRDAVLAAAGRLDLRMGGPSDREFDLEPGIHVTPRIDYGKFDCRAAVSARRGVYRFLFRTLPDPVMDALDCPAGDQPVPTRNASVTVQQALALWNSPFIAFHSEHLAERVRVEGDTMEARVSAAVRLVWGRPPRADEARDLAAYATKHGLANACRCLFNSSELLFVD